MFDVAPVSKDEGWAIGQVDTEHVLLRRTGGTWQRVAMPLPATKPCSTTAWSRLVRTTCGCSPECSTRARQRSVVADGRGERDQLDLAAELVTGVLVPKFGEFSRRPSGGR
ncbi:hypothetical protein AB0H83_29205 [Dactylosporangium sp. NPDC050688]|uniref:hypothetical protein n=1 Tax=Dactylosporangium sp. NPDC050688 TaxID=3157217 RepID=UPI003404FDE1